jgi:hypothetical protein
MNELLLEAGLNESALFGTIGGPAAGGFFTVTLGTATDGTLKDYVVPNSIGLSMPLTNIRDGMGLLVSDSTLQPFDADASANITANQVIPEPAAALLLLVAASVSAVSFRRRRCG